RTCVRAISRPPITRIARAQPHPAKQSEKSAEYLVERIDLYQRHACRAVYSPHNRRVVARRYGAENGRLGIIWRRVTSRRYLGFPRASAVIVKSNQRPISIANLKSRTSKWLGNPEIRQQSSKHY